MKSNGISIFELWKKKLDEKSDIFLKGYWHDSIPIKIGGGGIPMA